MGNIGVEIQGTIKVLQIYTMTTEALYNPVDDDANDRSNLYHSYFIG
jgi:hypothetical protein